MSIQGLSQAWDQFCQKIREGMKEEVKKASQSPISELNSITAISLDGAPIINIENFNQLPKDLQKQLNEDVFKLMEHPDQAEEILSHINKLRQQQAIAIGKTYRASEEILKGACWTPKQATTSRMRTPSWLSNTSEVCLKSFSASLSLYAYWEEEQKQFNALLSLAMHLLPTDTNIEFV